MTSLMFIIADPGMVVLVVLQVVFVVFVVVYLLRLASRLVTAVEKIAAKISSQSGP